MSEKEKKRGILLTIWLILILTDNTVTVLLLNGGFFTSLFPSIPSWAVYVLEIATILNVILATFLFMWKKWAFFAFCGVAGITFMIKLVIGRGIVEAIFGLLLPVILYLIMRSKWNFFK
jgi:hypothetical protein